MAPRCALAVATEVLASGCATITSSENQQVNLSAKTEQGARVEQAACSLKNDKGEWKAQAPGFVQIRRSSDDLPVEYSKPGTPTGYLGAISRAAAGMFGNIIFGGGIGAIIDHTKGTGYNYPDELPVVMGKTTTVDRHEASENAPAANASP